MADDTTRTEEERSGLLPTPADARMLTTLGMASKTPGRCACGEHPDPDAHPEGEHDD